MKQWLPWVCVCAMALSVGCKHTGTNEAAAAVLPDNAGEAVPAVPFEVRTDATELMFFWFDPHGAPHAVSRVDDVPSERRQVVRVDPSRPDLRAAGFVYVADLRAPGRDGRFPVHTVSSEAFASELAQLNGLSQAMAAAQPTPAPSVPNVFAPAPPPGQSPRVVIYGASWCSACHQAAAYLRQQNIPFVEHDIEREPQAAQEMYARAREQGVPTGSIPIIEVSGRLMVGFNPGALQQALRGG